MRTDFPVSTLCRTGVRLFLGAALILALGLPQPSARAQSTDPSLVGQWSPVSSAPVVAVNTSVLPNGELLIYPRNHDGQAYLWDPASGNFTYVADGVTNLFCSGLSLLADGRLLVTGGVVASDTDGMGVPDTNIFDFNNNGWTKVADMNAGRWYPTNTTLADGEVLVVSGSKDASFTNNSLPQVWTGSGWRSLTGAVQALPLYPYMHLAPNGKVFLSGPGQTTQYLNTGGAGAWSRVASRLFPNRDYGASVLYDNGKVVMFGGGDAPTNTAEVINLNAATPAWRYTQVNGGGPQTKMASARRHMNATLLPDGTILITGGTSSSGFNDATGSVLAAELWDPATEQFVTLASMAVPRLYHSTAVLLPDGRVFSGGGGQPAAAGTFNGQPDAAHLNYEIYSPPYLFAPGGDPAVQPTISAAPGDVGYGQSFFVETSDAASIVHVNWIRLSSVTHTRNMDQRINRLSFTPAPGGLTVTSPVSAYLCPPGYYMLFLLNAAGVPSVAKIIRIGPPPAAPANLRAAAVSISQVNLDWSDSATTEDGFAIERSPDGISFVQIATVGANVTAYADTGLKRNSRYYYRVAAYNGAGKSAYSNIATIRTLRK